MDGIKTKLLLIDDDDIDFFIFQKMFGKIFPNYELRCALNGLDGLFAIHNSKPDIIFLNINMPILNGWEVLDELIRLKTQIPIVMYSSSWDKDDIERAMKLEVCDYINKPISEEKIREIPEIIAKYKARHGNDDYQVGLTLVEGKVRAIKLYKCGKYEFFDNSNDSHLQKGDQQNSKIESNELAEEFEYLINNPKTKEVTLHKFFERNPDFILNDDYEAAHSKVTLDNPDGKVFIPDFLLEPYNKSSFCDLLELKLPNAKLFTIKPNRVRYSSAVLEACAQLREYAAYFDSKNNRQKIDKKYSLKVYKPKMIVIIGRQSDLDPEIIRRAQLDLPDLQLKTYDDILHRIKNKSRLFKL